MSGLTAVFSSQLAPVFARYIGLKRTLGRLFDNPARTLELLDRFLRDQATQTSMLLRFRPGARPMRMLLPVCDVSE